MTDDRTYLLVKRGLYYRPDNCGYTGIKNNAGRYRASDASPRHGVLAVPVEDAPHYAPGCFHDLAAADFAHRARELAKEGRVEDLIELADAFAALLAGFPDWHGLDPIVSCTR